MDGGVVMKELRNQSYVRSHQEQGAQGRNNVPKNNFFGDIKSILRNASKSRNYPQIEEITSKASSVKNLTIVKSNDKSSVKNPEQKTEQKKIVIKVSTTQKIASLYLKAIYDVFHLYQKSNNSLVQFAAFLFGFTVAAVMVILPPSWFFIPYMISRKDTAVLQANRSNDSLKPFVDTILEAFIGYMKPISSEIKEIHHVVPSNVTQYQQLINEFITDLTQTTTRFQGMVDNFQQNSGTIQTEANHVIKQINAKKKEYVNKFNELVKDIFQDLSNKAACNYTKHKSEIDLKIDDWIRKIESLDLPEKNELLVELAKLKSDIHQVDIGFKAEADGHFKTDVKQHKLDQKRKDYTIFNQRITERSGQDETRLQDIIKDIKIKQAQNSGEWEQLMNDQITIYELHIKDCKQEIEQTVDSGIEFNFIVSDIALRPIAVAKDKLLAIVPKLEERTKSLRQGLQEKIHQNKAGNKTFDKAQYEEFVAKVAIMIEQDSNDLLSENNKYWQEHVKVGYLGYRRHLVDIEKDMNELSELLDKNNITSQNIKRRLDDFKRKIEENNSMVGIQYEGLCNAEELEDVQVKSFVHDLRVIQADEINTLKNLKKDSIDRIKSVRQQKLLDSIVKYKKSVKELNTKINELRASIKDQASVKDPADFDVEKAQLVLLRNRFAKTIEDFEKDSNSLMNGPEILSIEGVNDFNNRTVEQSAIDTRDYNEIEAAINNKIQEKLKNKLDETLAKYILHVDKTLQKTKSLLNEIKEVKDAFPHKDEYFYKSLEIDHSAIKNLQDQLIRSIEEFKGKVQMLQNSGKIEKEDIQGLDTAIKKRILEDTNRLSELQHVMNGRLRNIARDAVSYYQDPHITSIQETLPLAKRAAVILPNYEDYLAKIESFLKRLEQQYETFDSDEIDQDKDLNIEKVKVFEDKIDEQKINDLKDLEEINLSISKDIEILLSAETKQLIDYDSHVKLLKADILRESANIKDERYLKQEMIDFEKLDKVLAESRESFIKIFTGFEVGTSNKEIKELNTTINKQIESNIDEYKRILNQIALGRKNYYAGLMAEKLKEYSEYVKEMAKENDQISSAYKNLVKEERRVTGDSNEKILLNEVETIISNEYNELMTKLFFNFEVWTQSCDEWSLINNLNANKANEFIEILENLKKSEGASNKRWRSRLDSQWEKYQYAKSSNGEIKRYQEHAGKLTHIINLAFGKERNPSISEAKERFISYLTNNYLNLVRLREHHLEAGRFEGIVNTQQLFKDRVEALMSQDNSELVKLLQLAVVNKYSEFKLSKEKIDGEFKKIRTEITEEFAEQFVGVELVSLTASEERFKFNADEITKQHELLLKKADISSSDVEKYVVLVDRSLEATDEEINSIKEAISRKWGHIARNLVEDYKKHLDDEIAEALKTAQQISKPKEFTAEIIKLCEVIKVARLLTTESIAVTSKVTNTALLQSIEKQKINDRKELESIRSRLMIVKQQTEKKEAAMKEASDFVMSYFNDISEPLLELRTAVQGLSTELATEKENLIKKIDKFATEANDNIIKFQKDADEVTDDDKNKFLDKVNKQKQSDAKKVDELRQAYHELKVKEIELKIIKAVAFYEKHANVFPPRVNVLSKQCKGKQKFEALLKRLEVLNKSVATSKAAYVKESKMIIKTLKSEHQESADTFITNIKKQIEADNNDISGIEKELKDQELLNLKDKAGRLVAEYSEHTVVISNSLQKLKQEFGEITELPKIDKLFLELTKTMSTKLGDFNLERNNIKDRKTLTEQDILTFEKTISNQVGQDKSKLEELNKAVRGMVKEEKLKKVEQTAEKYKEHMIAVSKTIGEIKADIGQEPIPGFDSAKEELNRLEWSMPRSLSELEERIKTIADKTSITEEDTAGFDELVDAKINFDKNNIGDVRKLVQKELERVAKQEVEQYKTHLDHEISDLETRIANARLGDQSDEISLELGYLKASINEPTAISEKAATLKKVNELSVFRSIIVSQKKNDEATLEKINKTFLEILAKVNNAKLHEELQKIIKQYWYHVGELEGQIPFHQADIREMGEEFNEIDEALESFLQHLGGQHTKYKGKASDLSAKGNNLEAKDVEGFKKEIVQEELSENKALEVILSLIPEKMRNTIENTLKNYTKFAKETSLFLDQQSTIIHRFSKESVARHYESRLQESLTVNSEKFTSKAKNFYQEKGAMGSQQLVKFVEDVNAALNEGKKSLEELQERIQTELKDWASGQVSEYKDHLNTEVDELRLTITGNAVPEEARNVLLHQLDTLAAEIKQAKQLTSLSTRVVDEGTAIEFEVGIKDQKRVDNEKLKWISTEFSKLLEQDQSKKQLNEVLAKYNQHIVESLKTLEHISDVADKPSVKNIMEQIFANSRDLQQALVTQREKVVKSPVLSQKEIKKDDIESFTVLTTTHILANNKKIEELKKEMAVAFKEGANTAVRHYKPHLDTEINKARADIGQDKDLAAKNPTKGKILTEINELEKNIHEAEALSTEASNVADDTSFEALSKNIDVQKGEDRKKLSELINEFEVEQEAARLGNMGAGYIDYEAAKKASTAVADYKKIVQERIEKIKTAVLEDPDGESHSNLLEEVDKARDKINERLSKLEKDSEEVKEEEAENFEQRVHEEKGKTDKELSELEKKIGDRIQNNLKEQVKKSSDEYKKHAEEVLNSIKRTLDSISEDEEELEENFDGERYQLLNLKKQVEENLGEAEREGKKIVEGSPIDQSRLSKFIADLKDKKSSEKNLVKKIESEINTRRQDYFKKKINLLLEEYQADSGEVFEQIINLQKSLEEKFPESDHITTEWSILRNTVLLEIRMFKARNREVEDESTTSIAYGKGKLSLFRGLVAKNKGHNHDALDRLSKSYNALRAKKALEQYKEHASNCGRDIEILERDAGAVDNREEYLGRLKALTTTIESKKSEFTNQSDGLINAAKSDEKDVTEFERSVTHQIKENLDELMGLRQQILESKNDAEIRISQEQNKLRGDYKNILSQYEEHSATLTKRITQILENVKPDGVIDTELTMLNNLRDCLKDKISNFKKGLSNLEKAEKVTKEQVGEFKGAVNSQQEQDLRDFGGAIAYIQKMKINTAELAYGDYIVHMDKINIETQRIEKIPKLFDRADELRSRVLLNKQRYQEFIEHSLDRNEIQSNEHLFDMINYTIELSNNTQRNIEEENEILRALIAEAEQIDESSIIDGEESDVELPEDEEELLPENFDIQKNKKVLFDLISDLEKSCENAGVSPHRIRDLKVIFSKVFSTQNKNNEKLFYMNAARFTEYTNELFYVVKKDLDNYKNDEDWMWSKEAIFRVCDNYYYQTANSRLDTNRGIAQQDINQLVKTVLDRCIFAEDTSVVVNYTESDFSALFGLNLHKNLTNRKIMQTAVQTLYRTLGKREGSEISWQDIKKILEEFDRPSNISHTERMRQIYGALIAASTIFGSNQDIGKILDIWQSCWGVFQDPKFIVPATTLDKDTLRTVNKKFNTLKEHNKESKVPLVFHKFGQFLDDFKRLSNLELSQNPQVNDIQDRFLAIIPVSYKKKYKLQKGNLITHLSTLKSDDRKELFTSVNIEQNRSTLLALCSDCEKYNILHPMFKLFLPGGIDQQPKKSDSIKPNKAKEISLETINDFDGERNFSFLKVKFDEFYNTKIERLRSMIEFQKNIIGKLEQKISSIDEKYKDHKKAAVSVKNRLLAEEEKSNLTARIEKCVNRNIELEKQINTIKEMKMSELNMIM